MKYDFANGLGSEFVYAASAKVPYRAEFRHEEGGIRNEYLPQPISGEAHQYISCVERAPAALPFTAAIDTKFDCFGAPLMVVSEEVRTLPDGKRQYGRHYEAVLFEKGINIWRLDMQPDGSLKPTLLCHAEAEIPAGEWHRLEMRVTRSGIQAWVSGCEAKAECPLPEKMWVGFTACEGINHFRYFEMEEA